MNFWLRRFAFAAAIPVVVLFYLLKTQADGEAGLGTLLWQKLGGNAGQRTVSEAAQELAAHPANHPADPGGTLALPAIFQDPTKPAELRVLSWMRPLRSGPDESPSRF